MRLFNHSMEPMFNTARPPEFTAYQDRSLETAVAVLPSPVNTTHLQYKHVSAIPQIALLPCSDELLGRERARRALTKSVGWQIGLWQNRHARFRIHAPEPYRADESGWTYPRSRIAALQIGRLPLYWIIIR